MKNWQDEYLPPFINTKKITYKDIVFLIIKVVVTVVHSLWFHDTQKHPRYELPNITNYSDRLFETTKSIYDGSLDRIKKIEDKAFKLLSYYSALFALLSFLFIQAQSNGTVKTLIMISLILLFISIIISFRCLNIKSTKQIYITDIYEFGSTPKQSFNKNELIKSQLECGLYNDNIADNCVDMLNGARYTLIMSLLICLFGIVLFGFTETNKNLPNYQKSQAKSLVEISSSLQNVISIIEKNNAETIKLNSYNFNKFKSYADSVIFLNKIEIEKTIDLNLLPLKEEIQKSALIIDSLNQVLKRKKQVTPLK